MIIYACQDLLFATRIRATAESLGIPTRPGRDARALQARLDQIDDGKLNEPVSGVIIDLDTPDSLSLITQCKTHDATLPVVAFGSHVMAHLLQEARKLGADFVMPRSMFTSSLVDILARLNTKPASENDTPAQEN